MTDLKKIIDRAVENGFKFPEGWMDYSQLNSGGKKIFLENIQGEEIDFIIFSHSFLRAFFGEEMVCGGCGAGVETDEDEYCKCINKDECGHLCVEEYATQISWRYHAQQLVLSENRLEYLMKYCENNNK